MKQNYDGFEFYPSESSQQSVKQGSVHNSHREYTFAPYNINEILKPTDHKSKYHSQNPKKSASQPSNNYLSKLKQQYAPQQSTQSTNHSQVNTKPLGETGFDSHDDRRVNNNKEKTLIQEIQQQKKYFENELSKCQSIIRNLENDLKLSQQLTEYMKQYQDQNEMLSKSIEDAIKKLNIANSTINQLEKEKESLLDYIEEQKEQQQKIQQKPNSDSLVAQLKQQIDKYNKELMEKEDLIKQINNQNQDEVRKYQYQITELQTKLMDYEITNKDLSRKFNDSVSQIQVYLRQSDEKQSHFQFTQNQEQHSVCDFDSNVKSSHNTNIIYKQQQGLDQMVKKNQQTLQDFQTQLQLHQQLGQFQEKISGQLVQIEQLNTQLQQQQIQIYQQNLNNQSQQARLNKQIFDMSQNVERLQSERQQQIEEIEQLQQQIMEQNQINQDLNKKYFEQQEGKQEFQHYSSKYNALQIKFQADTEYYENLISEFNQQLNKIQRKIDEMISYLRQETYPTIMESSTQQILHSLEILETLIVKNQSSFKLSNTQMNFSTNQTPTNNRPTINEYFESNQKVSIMSNCSTYSKPYLVKRNYYL